MCKSIILNFFFQEKHVISQSTSGDEVSEDTPPEAFRCGTTTNMVNKRMPLKRRIDYGEAIRKYMARPKSAADFFGSDN